MQYFSLERMRAGFELVTVLFISIAHATGLKS